MSDTVRGAADTTGASAGAGTGAGTAGGGAADRARDPNCIFCRIVADELPSKRVAEDDVAIAFLDINPQAPTHILVVPRVHIPSAAHLTDDDSALSGHLLAMAAAIARREGISEGGYRIMTAVGKWAGQTVDHLHFHVMGGRPSRRSVA